MYDQAIETLIDLERRCDTARLMYGGVSYWPLVRQKLWGQLMQRLINARGATPGVAALPATPPTRAVGGELSGISVGDPSLGLCHVDRAAAEQAVAAGALNPTALFLMRPEEYMDTINGGRFAKTVDSVLERAKAHRPVSKIELLNAETVSFKRTHPSLFLSLPHAAQGTTFDPPYELEAFDEVAGALTGSDLTLDANTVRTDMGKIFYFARIFEKLFHVLRPAAVFQSLYYWPVGMAYVLAARRLGILSLDIQHGRLGPHEGHYTHQTAAPAGGYDLVPDLVWCWGAQTKHDIEHAKNPACRRHGGIVGGNAWFHRWRYGDASAHESPEASQFLASIADRKKILVSLQLHDNPLWPALLDAMRASPPSWLWMVRVHPIRRHTIPQIVERLKENGIHNVEIETTSALPLFVLLRAIDHHVTIFSSVTVEAASFDVRTSLIGDEALSIFPSHIAAGICRYTPTGDEIVRHITEMLSAPRTTLHDDFMDMTPSLPDQALDALLP